MKSEWKSQQAFFVEIDKWFVKFEFVKFEKS